LVTPLSRDITRSLESESEYSDKASKPLQSDSGKLPAWTPRQLEAARLAEEVLNGEWINDAGKWIGRIKVDADKVFRVMADVKSAIVEGRVRTTPARMAEFNWGCSNEQKKRS